MVTQGDESIGARISRRNLLQTTSAALGVGLTTALSGCAVIGSNHAVYWSDPGTVDADYDAVQTAARETDYDVIEPFYVGTLEPRGLAPTGMTDLDQRLGPDYRVFGIGFPHTDSVHVECWFTGDVPTVSLFDDRRVMDSFPMESLPPEEWLVERLHRTFDISENGARDHAAALRTQVTEETDRPSIDVDAPVTFSRVYSWIDTERTDAHGSETGGDGWYTETSRREDIPFATVDFIVQSMKIRRVDGDRTYTCKLDRLGGFYLHISLPTGEQIPEDEYRAVFRELFADVGLPSALIEDLAFEYTPSMW